MSLRFNPYVMHYTAPDGATKKIQESRASDEEAKAWVKYVIERDKGSAWVVLTDGSRFVWPESSPAPP